jgi:ABC-type sugar transport system substrate-binding protein
MKITSKRGFALAGLVAAAIGLTACGSSNNTSSSTNAAATTASSSSQAGPAAKALQPYLKPPTALVVSTPLTKRPPQGKKVVFLSNGIEIAQEIGAGMKAGAAALGWNYKTLSVDQNNPATVTSSMLAAINDGADAVFVSATPSAVFKSALPAAKAKGTSVIDVASGNGPQGLTSLVNNAKNNGPVWGKILALGALADAEKAHETAKMVLVTSPIFQTILGPTDGAAKATVSQVCPKCSFHVLPIAPNRLFTGKAPSDVVSYLQAHPDVKYVLQDSSLTDQGLVPALKGAGLSGIKIYGVAPLKPQVAAVQAGDEQGWVVDPLQVEGWMAIDAAARATTGDDPKLYNSEGIPAYLLTKANASSPAEVPADYASQFKKMWTPAG